MKEFKIADTLTLCELADAARQNNYNRQLSQEAINDLDPEGIHICQLELPHEHRAGESCEMHIRGMWMAKMKGTMEPVTLFIDAPPDMYANLPVEMVEK